MKKVADKHNFACLLHEKPFEGINGSGKHNNWSMITSEGENLLDPGKNPEKNTQFLLFLAAIIKAIDEYQDIMRVSVASAGNDHRLGANEAPPAIVSVYVGDALERVLESIENGEADFKSDAAAQMETGAHVLPHFRKDNTDRNRTSPFAFTGNKFEFRMPGSSLSVADPNIVLNTAVAEAIDHIADRLSGAAPEKLEEEAAKLIKELVEKHRRIVFNGNGYTDEWVEEAEKRGLFNLKSLPEAMPRLIAEKNKQLFIKHHVFTESEIDSRYEIFLENYSKTIRIEAFTMLEMVKKDFTEGLLKYQTEVTATALSKKQLLSDAACALETGILSKLDAEAAEISKCIEKLEKDLHDTEGLSDSLSQARAYHDKVLRDMEELRFHVDHAESMIPESCLPYPTYSKLLFSLR
jgi:glutamine synthetase